jgi:hypothetical protein
VRVARIAAGRAIAPTCSASRAASVTSWPLSRSRQANGRPHDPARRRHALIRSHEVDRDRNALEPKRARSSFSTQ